jgi:hypothetical protein
MGLGFLIAGMNIINARRAQRAAARTVPAALQASEA